MYSQLQESAVLFEFHTKKICTFFSLQWGITERENQNDPSAPLFLGKFNRPLNRDALRLLVNSLGEKVGGKKYHPHRFRHIRHTFALRSGGDIFTLESLLGRGSLDMVEHYARIAQVDIEQAVRKASPTDNWRL